MVFSSAIYCNLISIVQVGHRKENILYKYFYTDSMLKIVPAYWKIINTRLTGFKNNTTNSFFFFFRNRKFRNNKKLSSYAIIHTVIALFNVIPFASTTILHHYTRIYHYINLN